jgi:hypothetical protein
MPVEWLAGCYGAITKDWSTDGARPSGKLAFATIAGTIQRGWDGRRALAGNLPEPAAAYVSNRRRTMNFSKEALPPLRD